MSAAWRADGHWAPRDHGDVLWHAGALDKFSMSATSPPEDMRQGSALAKVPQRKPGAPQALVVVSHRPSLGPLFNLPGGCKEGGVHVVRRL